MVSGKSDRKMILLNLGCGPDVRPTDWIDCDGSWNVLAGKLPRPFRKLIVRIGGFREWPRHVRFLNLRKRLPFPADSVDAVYASHVWEHLSKADAERATAESFRILRKGGRLRIVVPDLRFFCREYLSSKAEDAADNLVEKLHFRDRGDDVPFFKRLHTAMTDLHSHKWMYDERSLAALLRSTGFVEIKKRKCLESGIPKIRQVENRGRLAKGSGFALEAKKPL